MIKKAMNEFIEIKPIQIEFNRGKILSHIRTSKKGMTMTQIANLIDPNFNKVKDEQWPCNIMKRLESDQFINKKGKVYTLKK